MQYHSQIGQDKWVHSVLGDKKGFFVELGASDGVFLSNTLFFEKQGWNGICIEPNNTFFDKLKHNRKCHVSNELIYSVKGIEVDFAMDREASAILDKNTSAFTNKSIVVKKTTTTLADVLDAFNAPSLIDYLSLDVEGPEYDILSTFPFEKYNFRCITVEHNAPHIGPVKQLLIRNFLEKKGYIFVKGNDDVNNWGHGPIDDFYIYAQICP
jgi:FkbM family methyltransferase